MRSITAKNAEIAEKTFLRSLRSLRLNQRSTRIPIMIAAQWW